MSVYSMFYKLLKIIIKGGGSKQIVFDTEAARFHYHVVTIDSVYAEQNVNAYVVLYSNCEREYIRD